jgi:hypothetical protein
MYQPSIGPRIGMRKRMGRITVRVLYTLQGHIQYLCRSACPFTFMYPVSAKHTPSTTLYTFTLRIPPLELSPQTTTTHTHTTFHHPAKVLLTTASNDVSHTLHYTGDPKHQTDTKGFKTLFSSKASASTSDSNLQGASQPKHSKRSKSDSLHSGNRKAFYARHDGERDAQPTATLTSSAPQPTQL